VERLFQLLAEHPALDFVNTLDWRFREEGAEELLNSYADLVGFAEQSKLLSAAQARRLSRAAGTRTLGAAVDLRETLAEVFYACVDGHSPQPAALAKLERFFGAARSRQKFSWHKPLMTWSLPETEKSAELPLWLLSLSASELMTSDAMRLVHACDNPECRWLFLDTSRNHTRRWCDMKVCGNRMKARRFKAQRRGETG
jgi:predicted RNA-binding Zn ribbon-like protein